MTTLSNTYIEKVNSEHPLAVWMLNDQVDYLSSINESQRCFYDNTKWGIENGTATNETVVLSNTPFLNSALTRISGDIPSGPTMDIDLLSEFVLLDTLFSEELANFAMSFFLYIDNPYANSISFGYQYEDPLLVITDEVLVTKPISSLDSGSWVFFSNTFPLPIPGITEIKLVIKINVSAGGGVGDYDFLINGLAIGQWSEEFNKTSLGVVPIPLPGNIALPIDPTAGVPTCTPALPYGASTLSGYYLSHDYRLYANNYGIPIVYGSSNVTKIYTHEHNSVSYPALIFPGYGFLNERGKFNEYTAEMWLRINTDAVIPRKLFGPITGNDGLYVEGGFLTFVIGNKYGSHYVGEWFRPMLVHIRFIQNNISILLNGEQVINIDILESELELPEEFNAEGNSQDWLGFYSYADIVPIEIDSFALYSYSVPVEVAKRRWVWGQGVVAPETTNSAVNATTAFNDYSFSNYAVNYNYPDFASWRQAFFSNVETSSNFLQLPEYKLPEFYLNNYKTEKEWFSDIQDIPVDPLDSDDNAGYLYYTFRPNSSWEDQDCYIYSKNFNILNDTVESFYGVFRTDGSSVNETLFKIINPNTGDYILVKINGTTLSYTANIDGVSTIFASNTVTVNVRFTAGINIPTISLSNIPGINKFFSDQSLLSIYMAGDSSVTFSGRVYRIGFDAAYNSRKTNTLYDSNGIFNSNLSTSNSLMSHTANYTIKIYNKYGFYFIDIASAGYWEDYMPLSYFGKYVEDYEGNSYYDLDSIQINLDYPEPLEVSSLESVSSWTYADLKSRYLTPVQLDYVYLDNNFYSGWDDYEDMSQDSEKYYYYATSENTVRSYISFQNILDGANTNLVNIPYKSVARLKGVVDPNTQVDIDENGDPTPGTWENTAYEVVDGTIIYPPLLNNQNNTVDFNSLGIVYHLDFVSEGISHNPIKFRDLQLVSQVLERKQFTEIGTRFGVPVYPYSKSGFYYNFKGKNPISTYKGSTPYLYLNRHSGWRIRGEFSPLLDRGISLPINTQRGLGTEVSALQIWLRFSENYFPSQELVFFSIDHKDGTYDFYIKSDESTQRGYVYAKNRATNAIVDTIEYHVDGKPVDTAFLVNEQWAVLGIAFTELLSFDQYTGRLNLNGPFIYNNISYYLATNLEQNQRVEVRSWGEVKNDGVSRTWDYWENAFDWGEVKIISTINVYSIDPGVIYEKYVGTNRVIIDDNVDGLLVNPDSLRVYSDVGWTTSTQIAV